MVPSKLGKSLLPALALALLATLLLAPADDGNAQSRSKRGWLGVNVQELTPSLRDAFKLGDRSGLLVTYVAEKSPAAEAGLQEEDVIVKYDGKSVEKVDAFTRLVRRTEPETEVALQIVRDGEEQSLKVRIGRARRADAPFAYSFRGDQGLAMLSGRPQLGVQVHDLNADLAAYFKAKAGEGVLVLEVNDDSPAAKAGLKAGDVLAKIDGEQISDYASLIELLADYDDGDEVEVEYLRDGRRQSAKVELAGSEFMSQLRPHTWHRFGRGDRGITVLPRGDAFQFYMPEFRRDRGGAELRLRQFFRGGTI